MLNKNNNTELRCKNTAVDLWLAERSQMIVQFCKLSGYRNQAELPESKQINGFCDILIDYVSAGHFEVYESLVADCETQGDASLELAKNLYPEITLTTETALVFNDKYADHQTVEDFNQLGKDLSMIGETIALRIELEDQLIETFYKNH